jgi:hypothetical protein
MYTHCDVGMGGRTCRKVNIHFDFVNGVLSAKEDRVVFCVRASAYASPMLPNSYSVSAPVGVPVQIRGHGT